MSSKPRVKPRFERNPPTVTCTVATAFTLVSSEAGDFAIALTLLGLQQTRKGIEVSSKSMVVASLEKIDVVTSSKVKYQFLSEISPTALWQKLEKIYMSKSLSIWLDLKKDLYQFWKDKGSDLGDYISEFSRLVSQLSSIDVKLEEEDQAILLLSLLPKSCETLKTTLLIGNETLLVDNVMSALMDLSSVNGTSSRSQGEGLVVRSENKNGHGRDRGRSRSRNT
ncbi:hypothetical protein RJ640_028922 [Escallonia rubra]|uniref:Uncharacterized protein n=1 Tax=Escallonia rubra TaxID=112253 RepID=A0AA88QD28_9ASTE|nr:hypothetical protein RJ640_028922 [Escallonia rubra]